MEVVEDTPSSRAMNLKHSGKIKPRAKVVCYTHTHTVIITPTHIQVVFGTGDSLKAVTLTANEAFVRAAAHQV